MGYWYKIGSSSDTNSDNVLWGPPQYYSYGWWDYMYRLKDIQKYWEECIKDCQLPLPKGRGLKKPLVD